MSRKSRRSQSVRPTGLRPGTENATLAAAEQFDAAVQQAALDNQVSRGAPAGHVQTIVPGANYGGKPNTRESAERLAAMKHGVDPALNRKFETAIEAREYRRANSVDVMSPREFEAEMSGKGSSIVMPAWMKDTGNVDPETGRQVPGFKGAEAFRQGAEAMRGMPQQEF